jgi:hypothetical protein
MYKKSPPRFSTSSLRRKLSAANILNKRKTSVQKQLRDQDRRSSPKHFKDHSLLRLLREYTNLRVDRKVLPLVADKADLLAEELAKKALEFLDERRLRTLDEKHALSILHEYDPELYDLVKISLEEDKDIEYLQRNPIESLLRAKFKLFESTEDRPTTRMLISYVDMMRRILETFLIKEAMKLGKNIKNSPKKKTIKERTVFETNAGIYKSRDKNKNQLNVYAKNITEKRLAKLELDPVESDTEIDDEEIIQAIKHKPQYKPLRHNKK